MKPTGKHPYRPDFSQSLSADDFMEIFDKSRDSFKHLQVFMSKSKGIDFGNLYMMFGKHSFGVVRLLNIDYHDEKIILDLQDVQANRKFSLPIDIHRRGFQCMFYNFQDIKNIITEVEKATDGIPDEGNSGSVLTDLLELDESQPIQQ